MPTLWMLSVGCCLLFALSGMALAAAGVPEVDSLPSVRELPDPFLFENGTRVKTKRDWSRRRTELKRIVQRDAYGTLPPAGGRVRMEETASAVDEATGGTEKSLRLLMGPGGQIAVRMILTIPSGSGPFPVAVTGDLGWGRLDPKIVAEGVRRGCIVAAFDRTDVVPDAEDRTSGLRAAYPDADIGALAAWAWGFHRVVDALRRMPEVDRERIIVTGHSRGGKAALLAGALDERIALTAPNNSGCMGAGCTRIPHEGETLERIVSVFPYWFAKRLASFVKREDRLPFDQHSLKALVAPRALLSTEAMGDEWANPPGTQLTHQAARIVYDFLGAGDRIGIVFRSGGHAHTLEDWKTLFDFADWRLRDRTRARDFDRLAYPDESAKSISWTAPKGIRN